MLLFLTKIILCITCVELHSKQIIFQKIKNNKISFTLENYDIPIYIHLFNKRLSYNKVRRFMSFVVHLENLNANIDYFYF